MPGERPILYTSFTPDGIKLNRIPSSGIISTRKDIPDLREELIAAKVPIVARLHKDIFSGGPFYLFQPEDNTAFYLIPVPQRRRNHMPGVQISLENSHLAMYFSTEKRKPIFVATFPATSLDSATLSWDDDSHQVNDGETLILEKDDIVFIKLGRTIPPLIHIQNTGNVETEFAADIFIHPQILKVVKY